MLPGERRIARWGMGRVQKVQGSSKDLVAGAYVIVASLWGSIGGVLVLLGIALDVASKGGTAGSTLLLVGFAPLAVAGIRIVQSRRARQSGNGG
jgi:hypothetical protein